MRLSLFSLTRHRLLPGGLLSLMLLAGETAGQEGVDERYRLPVITRPTRSYFAQLDDSEYASLSPAAAAEQPLLAAPGAAPLLLFPVLQPRLARSAAARRAGRRLRLSPLRADRHCPQAGKKFSPAISGRWARSRAMVELAESGSPEAAAILMRRVGQRGGPGGLGRHAQTSGAAAHSHPGRTSRALPRLAACRRSLSGGAPLCHAGSGGHWQAGAAGGDRDRSRSAASPAHGCRSPCHGRPVRPVAAVLEPRGRALPGWPPLAR